MFEREEIEKAVDIQQRAYRLLQWMEGAFERGFIAPETAGEYASSEDAAFGWLEKHLLNLPEDARPDQRDLRAFSNYFSTYLINSFDIEATPGERLYSPDAHCFCPICSWMVRAPHIKAKKVTAVDKKRAERLKSDWLNEIAASRDRVLSEEIRDQIMNDPSMREAVGLCAYAADLLQRMKGFAQGPATLALWRSFAWTAQGSPKKSFVLSVDAIMDAQQRVLARICAVD